MQAFLTGVSQPKEKLPITQKVTKKQVKQPWVEKYRPKCVDEVSYQDEVVSVLKASLKNQDLPNLLFYGPPGTGKTSTILAMARELFGDIYRDRILELNASDERGINVVRDKIKTFSQLTASSTRPDGRACPPLKIIILDEADSMTGAAQAALRRTMEKESRTTRFCLICNYVSRIIEPIASRCAKFRFKPLSGEVLTNRLKHICQEEGVNYLDESLAAIIEISEGDMRRAISTLQSATRMKGQDSIARRDIIDISGVIDQSMVEDIYKSCQSGSYENIDISTKRLMMEGHSAGQLILQLHDYVIDQDDLTDLQKSFILQRIAVMDKRLIDGADEYLQILDLCTVIMQQLTT